jgi:hypothetical protein
MVEGTTQNPRINIIDTKNKESDICKTTITSMKKGRFLIETAKTENCSSLRKSKFRQCCNYPNGDIETLLSIIAKQHTQIELLYDMFRNLAGNSDKLFEHELVSVLTSTYDQINELKNKFKTNK